ncbi:CrcB family protein [Solwaraspora sp. WMMD406]|uniref:fluoride efflux transporter FluC n=1 Tax=Solwaraspora sp. WMMD406 TaxID=3016095 RepID=UPI002417F622|nr:CrcB family protein [Solwaraspora sp. WMMD406]MDG4763089.1 CrcB family protein [Solwaraspora sp. WMMD406]
MPPRSTAPAVLAAVAVGGAIGAAARYGLAAGWPVPADGFPWPTLATNLVGCALIGVLMAVVAASRRPHRLLRPFFGAGLLGGFTTFSVQSLEVWNLVDAGRPWSAGGYALGTLVGALASVWLGGMLARPWAVRLAERSDGGAG